MVRAVEGLVKGSSSAGAHIDAPLQGPPHVIVFAGVNGVGKTTTIAKVGARYRAQGRRVLLAAATRSARAPSISLPSGRSGSAPTS